MRNVIWFFIVSSAIGVFVIAAITIGREAHRLDSVAPRAIYEIEQATKFVADQLPAATQARLTMKELGQLLVLHMNWLHSKGLLPDKVVDRRQDIAIPIVVSDETLIGYLLGEAENAGVQIIEDVDIAQVTQAHLKYLDAIGAVGPQTTDI